MPTFTFRGFTAEGNKVGGSKKFQSKELVEKYLDSKHISNYQVFESGTQYSSKVFAIVSPKELSVFCRQMSVLFFSQITLMEGVLLLAEQSENKDMKIALQEINEHMNNGYTFADAIGMYGHIFSSYLLNMITIGETSGTLDRVLSKMSDYYDKENRMRKKLKSAIVYPAILTALMAAIVLLLILKILPMFNEILKGLGQEMPAITAVLLQASLFLSKYIIFIVPVFLVILFGFLSYIKTEKGSLWFDKTIISVPIGKYINSRVVTARFSRSLSILLKSGVQLLNAIEDIKTLMDNKYLEEKFSAAVVRLRQGDDLTEVLKEIDIFPPLFLKMVIIGNNTGHLDEMLDKSASIFDEEVDDAIERVTVMIEPILIIVLSIVVGVILLSVMLPMIDIMTAIG